MKKFLDQVLVHKNKEIKEKEKLKPLASFKDGLVKATGRFKNSLCAEGLRIIGEIKPRSPALGKLFKQDNEIDENLAVYKKYAQAVSVLTDEKFFGGSIELLKNVISLCPELPALLKDFVINPYQIYEAREAGAEAVLLIAKILSASTLLEFYTLAKSLNMDALVEVQNESELALARKVNAELILVNNRNLDTLEIDLKTVERLLGKSSNANEIIVAASGIETGKQLIEIRPYASRFLIGSALMSAKDPESKFREFLEAERSYLQSAHTWSK